MRIPIKLLSLLAVIILLATATGCDSGNGGNNQTLTENDFANDASLRADPDKDLIVDFLEPPGSDTPQYDTGPLGIDDIPVTYTKTQTHTFCWKDDNGEAMDYMELLDSEGQEVLRVDVNGDCVTDTIEPGDYVMTLYHDGSMGDTLPVFIIPNPDNNQQARETDGLFNGFKVVMANILKGIQNTLTKDARAQTVQENIDTLLNTRGCSKCILRNAKMTGANLSIALWCDGNCECTFSDSIGTCGGCPSVEEVCTGS
jgi:hypothetical protein